MANYDAIQCIICAGSFALTGMICRSAPRHTGRISPQIRCHDRIIIDRSLASIAALEGIWAKSVWAKADMSPSQREGEEGPGC